MPRKKTKKKAKQIVVTKEKLQKIQEAKKQVVEQAKVVKQEVKQEVKTTYFCDMLGKPLFVGDNVVYVYSNKQGKTSTKAGKIDNFTNKSIVVKTLDNELIKVRNVIKINVTELYSLQQPVKKVVKPRAKKVKKQVEVKKPSILSFLKCVFTK